MIPDASEAIALSIATTVQSGPCCGTWRADVITNSGIDHRVQDHRQSHDLPRCRGATARNHRPRPFPIKRARDHRDQLASFRSDPASGALVVMLPIAILVRDLNGHEHQIQLDEGMGRCVRSALLESHRLTARAWAARELLKAVR